METDRPARLRNRERVHELANAGHGVRVFCSHDPLSSQPCQRLIDRVAIHLPERLAAAICPKLRTRMTRCRPLGLRIVGVRPKNLEHMPT